MTWFSEFIAQVFKTSLLEWSAVFTGVLYLIFAVKEKIICWIFGIISSTLYLVISYQNQLYLDLGLQFFYVLAGFYGWFSWQKPKKEITINEYTLNTHSINILVLSLLSMVVGYLFDTYTSQFNPYLDAFITLFSFYATFLITQKVLSNWIYWIIINLLGVILFGTKGLYLTSLLYIVNAIMAIIGFIQWKRAIRKVKN